MVVSEVLTSIMSWGTKEEGQMLLEEVGIREAVLEPHWATKKGVHRGVKEKVNPERTSGVI